MFFNRLGEIRDRSYENQRYRASGLNLLVAAIILWNTVYLQRAVEHLRRQGIAPAPISDSPPKRFAIAAMLSNGLGEFSGTSIMRKPSSKRISATGIDSSGLMPRGMAMKGSGLRYWFSIVINFPIVILHCVQDDMMFDVGFYCNRFAACASRNNPIAVTFSSAIVAPMPE